MILRKPAFYPSMYSGCLFWMDASDPTRLVSNISRAFRGEQSEYVVNTSFSTGNIGLSYTLVTWIKPTATSGTYGLLSIGSSSDPSTDAIFGNLYISANQAAFTVKTTTCTNALSGLAPNREYMIAGRRDIDNVQTFVNGRMAPAPGVGGSINASVGSDTITAGATNVGSFARTDFYSGVIHGAALWDRALSDTELTVLYSGGAPSLTHLTGNFGNNLYCWWGFSEKSGMVIAVTGSNPQGMNAVGTTSTFSNFNKSIYSGCAINLWRDKSGTNRHFRQAVSGAFCPTLSRHSGMYFLDMSDFNSWLQGFSLANVSSVNFETAARNISIFAVLQPRSLNNFGQVVFSMSSNSPDASTNTTMQNTAYLRMFTSLTTGNPCGLHSRGWNGAIMTLRTLEMSQGASAYSGVPCVQIVSHERIGANATVIMNNQFQAKSSYTLDGNTISWGYDVVAINNRLVYTGFFPRSGFAANVGSYYLYELALFNSPLGPIERQKLYDYARNKWYIP